ncbi:MAG: type II toxin-antitoxin system PemK/MazF family toxin [bacterium]|nr:type II toxin-antitoxin system PemK/MazF family toxin [bacterium]
MRKDFDTWNVCKKELDVKARHLVYRAQEVWWCHLGVNIGFEQDGTGEGFNRPVLIVKGLSRSTCIVLPLTSSVKIHPMRIPLGLVKGKEASALLSQIRVIDTRRLIERVCFIGRERFEPIQKAVRDLF